MIEEASTALLDGAARPGMDTQMRILSSLHSDQVFLGLVATHDQPKLETQQLVDRMMNGGVRFVYFSVENERRTHAFGTKINLFTGFNHFLSLREPLNQTDEHEVYVGKSRLPRGLRAIRRHLDSVDNVPLLVSLLADCTPSSMADMIRIYQDHGETVVVLGSPLVEGNLQGFMQADASFSQAPLATSTCPHDRSVPASRRRAMDIDYTTTFEYKAAEVINASPCVSLLPTTSNMAHMAAIVYIARGLFANTRQALWFYYASHLALFLTTLFTLILDAPTLLESWQAAWFSLVIIPGLCIPILLSPREPNGMRAISTKNSLDEETISPQRMLLQFGLRYTPSILAYGITFMAMTLTLATGQGVTVPLGSSSSSSPSPPSPTTTTLDVDDIPFHCYYWSRADAHWLDAESSQQWSTILMKCQLHSSIIFLISLIIISSSFLSREIPINKSLFKTHPQYLYTSIIIIILHFSLVFGIAPDPSPIYSGGGAGWLLLSLWPPSVIIALIVATRIHATQVMYDRRTRFFEFDTQLGMHSPVAKN